MPSRSIQLSLKFIRFLDTTVINVYAHYDNICSKNICSKPRKCNCSQHLASFVQKSKRRILMNNASGRSKNIHLL